MVPELHGAGHSGRHALRLPDAHAHPQDDIERADHMLKIDSSCVAVMGVKEEDWDAVVKLKVCVIVFQITQPLKFGTHRK